MKHLQISILLALGVGAPTALAQPNDAPQPFTTFPPPLRTPRRPRPVESDKQIVQDLTDFVGAINGDNAFPMAQKWIYEAKVGYFGANQWLRDMATRRGGVSLKIDKIAVDKIEGDSATATLTYSFTAPNANAWGEDAKAFLARPRNETLQLKRGSNPAFGGELIWQIIPAEQPQNFNEAEMSNVLSVVSYYLAQKQAINTAAVVARRSMQNLKQLGLGVAMFVIDWDDRYAFAPEYTQEALLPYLKTKEVFFVPNTQEAYSFNANLSDKNLAQVKEIDKTVLFYEGENEKPTFRYGGKAAIAFADGHVALVTPEEAKDLIWKP